MAQFIAKNLGLSGLPLIIMKHPLSGINKEEAEKKGESITEPVLHVLTQSRELLESEFKSKEYPLPSGVCPMTRPGI